MSFTYFYLPLQYAYDIPGRNRSYAQIQIIQRALSSSGTNYKGVEESRETIRIIEPEASSIVTVISIRLKVHKVVVVT